MPEAGSGESSALRRAKATSIASTRPSGRRIFCSRRKSKNLSHEIVGDETNPLEKARRIFRWISKNVPWCAEQEYSIIPSLSAKGLTARRGDCGVQGTSFITLCRAAGVPARWQSGWQLKPGELNMHDWAEIYIEPWGWLPADASWGVMKSDRSGRAGFFLRSHRPVPLDCEPGLWPDARSAEAQFPQRADRFSARAKSRSTGTIFISTNGITSSTPSRRRWPTSNTLSGFQSKTPLGFELLSFIYPGAHGVAATAWLWM